MKNFGYLVNLLALFGCCHANTTLLPREGDKAEIVAYSSDSNCCLKKALEKAEEHCKLKGKSYVVVDQKTEYQGADKTAKAVLGAVGMLSGAHSNTNSSDDYKTSLQFKCTQ